MSKFTKYLTRALDCAKPEKEAGLAVAVTKEGLFMCRMVGNPEATAQMLLHAAEVDEGMNTFLTYVSNEFIKKTVEELPTNDE